MQKFGWKKKRTSVTIAKERLRLILSSDLVNSTPEYMERIAEELFLTVSKYIEITPENFTVQITQSDIHIQLAGEKK